MNALSKFLEKFQNILKAGTEARSVVILVIKKNLNCEVIEKNVTIKDGIVYLKSNPSFRNELFLNKEVIISEINKLLPKNKNIRDIK